MADYESDQLYSLRAVTGVAGLGGGPQQIRGTEFRQNVKIRHFTLTNGTSASLGGVALANGDRILLTRFKVIDRIYFGRFFYGPNTGSLTATVGKLDPNNSANTDAAHYKASVSLATAGSFDLDLNMGEQVGTDPAGDESTGNTAPNFGSQDIVLTMTYGGATPNAAATINGYTLSTAEGA